jgi:hypothetical protein
VNSTFVKEDGYLAAAREGLFAAALLENSSMDLNKELFLDVSARNLELNLIL